MKDFISVLIDGERESDEAGLIFIQYFDPIQESEQKSRLSVNFFFFPFSVLATLSMFSCAVNRKRTTVLAIVFGVGLIVAAIAIGLSVGLTQKRAKSQTTTGSYRVKAFRQ